MKDPAPDNLTNREDREKPARRKPWWKKLLFAVVATALFFVVLELALMGLGIRPVNALEDPYVGFASYSPLFVEQTAEDGRDVFTTADNKTRWFNPQQFPAAKSRETSRVFTLGGSTTYGRPYDDTTSFSGWLREFLPDVDDSRNWEVVNAGGISYASYRVARVMEELNEHQPDLYIIYCGHNEFLERRTYASIIETPESIRNLRSLLGKTRTWSLLKRLLIRDNDGDTTKARTELPGEVKSVLDDAVGPDAYTRDDELREQIVSHYRFNLKRMVRLARSAGAKVILVAPASNLRDCSPFKSEPSFTLDDTQAAQFQELYSAAKEAADQQRWNVALRLCDRALELDRRYAHLHYVRGRILWELGKRVEAKVAFERARDEDVCPLRALTEMVDVVRAVAAEEDVPLVDFERILAEKSPDETPGEDWFLDHVHPTIAGHRLLAEHLLEAMRSAKVVSSEVEIDQSVRRRVIARVESRIDRRKHAEALKNLSKVLGWAGKHEEAQRLALRAVAMIPEDAEAQYQAGNAYVQLRQYDEAIRCYQQALKLSPGLAKACYGIGLALERQGRPDRAIDQFRLALRHDSDFANAHYKLGRLLAASNRKQLARKHFLSALKINPDDHLTRNQLGVLHARNGDLKAAEVEFQKALESRPGFSAALANLGRIHLQRGEERKAVEFFREALRGNAREFSAAYQLAELLATSPDSKLRDGRRALFWSKRLAERTGYRDASVLAMLAAAYAETGDFANAVKWQQAALKQAPASRRDAMKLNLHRYREGRPAQRRRAAGSTTPPQ